MAHSLIIGYKQSKTTFSFKKTKQSHDIQRLKASCGCYHTQKSGLCLKPYGASHYERAKKKKKIPLLNLSYTIAGPYTETHNDERERKIECAGQWRTIGEITPKSTYFLAELSHRRWWGRIYHRQWSNRLLAVVVVESTIGFVKSTRAVVEWTGPCHSRIWNGGHHALSRPSKFQTWSSH